MSAIIGSIIGLGASVATGVIDIINKDKEQKAKIAEMQAQTELLKVQSMTKIEEMKIASELKVKEIGNQADIEEGTKLIEHDMSLQSSGWMSNLRASVRPVITYVFFLFFLMAKISILFGFIAFADKILDAETMTLFSAVLSFWFGSRTINNMRVKK